MGLHAHLRDGAPMALIVCRGSFTGDAFWVESGGLVETKTATPLCTRVLRFQVVHARQHERP